MGRSVRRPFGSGVVLVSDDALFRRLQPRIADVTLFRATPDDAARLALEWRPGVLAWIGGDARLGLATILALREGRVRTRILFVTPRASKAERLAALEAGADEALAAPVSASELAARIGLLVRRARPDRVARLPIGDHIELDLDRRELLRDGDWVHLRPREAKLLELFARSPGRVLSRDHILERVWGAGHVGDRRTVDVHVRWLRAKIEPLPHEPGLLLTVRGVGYRLEPPALTER
jgi:DNA-binding response OmpR family regulator